MATPRRATPVAAIAYVDGNAGFQARWSWPVIGVFGVGWDDLQTLRADFPGIAQAQSNASRQVRVSNEIDFFDDFGGHYGAALPALSVSYGNEWGALQRGLLGGHRRGATLGREVALGRGSGDARQSSRSGLPRRSRVVA